MIALVGAGNPVRIIRIGIDFGTAGGLLVINTASTGADFARPCFEDLPLRYCDVDITESIDQMVMPTPRFTMPPAEQTHRPRFTNPQWTPTSTTPRKVLRCNRKGIGLRIKTTK